jgi:prepilin-type N-terminal cleavage/methylation domain-containing protein
VGKTPRGIRAWGAAEDKENGPRAPEQVSESRQTLYAFSTGNPGYSREIAHTFWKHRDETGRCDSGTPLAEKARQTEDSRENQMKSQQSGFTLVEIAIVLVIIGLLLGGVLKGQELINSAKVKNIANDFRVVPTYIYAFQDKFKALPGDDASASTHISAPAGVTITNGNGNGVIDGAVFDASNNPTSEALQFWQHVRLANLASGPNDPADAAYVPTNAVGGKISVTSMASGQPWITGMTGSYQVCSKGILGKFVKQLDIQMDDGNTATGSMRAVVDTQTTAGGTPVATGTLDESAPHTVCMTF